MRKEELKKRLNERCAINEFTGCWEWTRSSNGSGYGSFNFNGVHTTAHRQSYMAYKGEIPQGIIVCHTCDNKKCINPEHLFLGTYKDNYRDAVSKGKVQLGMKKRKEKIELHRKWREERKLCQKRTLTE